MRLIGEVLGEEALDKGARVLLAPTVNIHRHPVGGRSFECFSEDPLLSAAMAVAYVRGVQGQGVGCAIKHFVCNDQELDRMSIDIEVDERPLREIYLAPFEAAVQDAGVCMVMSAYNKLRGEFCSESRDLLRRCAQGGVGLRGGGGVGLVRDAQHRLPSAPGWTSRCLDRPPSSVQHLVDAVAQGEVRADAVRDAADRMLRLLRRLGSVARRGAPFHGGTVPHWRGKPPRRASSC